MWSDDKIQCVSSLIKDPKLDFQCVSTAEVNFYTCVPHCPFAVSIVITCYLICYLCVFVCNPNSVYKIHEGKTFDLKTKMKEYMKNRNK